MSKVTLIARLLLGFIFVGAGIAFFVMASPPPPEGDMGTFFNGLVASKYFIYLLKVTEIACGAMLMSGFFVPLALVVLAPIIINIFFVHAFLAPSGVPLALVLGVLEIYLAFFSKEYSPRIKPLFQKR